MEDFSASKATFLLTVMVLFLLGLNIFLWQKNRTYKKLTKKLCFERDYDMLTGLQNRNAFWRFFQRKEKEKTVAAFFIFDIDGLKLINDTMGHSEGDRLIQITAELLQKNCIPGGQLFRSGGDEYVLVLPNSLTMQEMKQIKYRIHQAVQVYNQKGDLPLSLSAGFAVPGNGESMRNIYDRADFFMYKEKREAKEKVYRDIRLILSEAEF